jgi:hypothetical protein
MSEELNEIEEVEEEVKTYDFPEGTVFYQELKEKDGVKWLCGTTDQPSLADQLGFLNNHFNFSELTLKNGVFYLKGYEKPEPTLEELKARKLAEISAEAHKYSQYECAEMYLTSSRGFRINADGRAQDNLKGLIGIGLTCKFKDYDNEFHDGITVEDLNLMLLECYQNGASLYQQKFAYEARVDAAKSAEDLNFEVTFSMADFSA